MFSFTLNENLGAELLTPACKYVAFPGGAAVKNAPANAGDARDVGSIPWSRRFPREKNGNPLQFSCLENSMGRGACSTKVHWVAKS